MSEAATLDTPTIPDKRTKKKPKLLPPYQVIVYNDDYHTFDYVMVTFQKVFGYTLEKCFILAEMIHKTGRASVWTGTKELAELKQEQIINAGPDQWANPHQPDFPLRVDIEPLE